MLSQVSIFFFFYLKDAKGERILIVSETLFLILRTTKSFSISSIWNKFRI